MSPRNADHPERHAIGLRLVAVALAVLPFGWMVGVSEGDLNASKSAPSDPGVQMTEAPGTTVGPGGFPLGLDELLTDE